MMRLATPHSLTSPSPCSLVLARFCFGRVVGTICDKHQHVDNKESKAR